MTVPDAQSAAANADANLARLVQIAAQADADASKSTR